MCWVALGSSRCLANEVLGLVLDDLELCDVAIELAGVCTDELVAFPDLRVVRLVLE